MSNVEPDVLRVFADDATSRLDRMGEQLLELEHAPGRRELVGSLLRDAHSLKGSARVIGLTHVADVAHALEGPLQGMRGGNVQPDAELLDSMLAAVDGLREMVGVAGGGDGSAQQAVAERLISRLGAKELAPGGGERMGAPSPTLQLALDSQRVTMQVAVQRLDEIERLVGESASAHLRVGDLLTERLSVDPATLPEFRDLARLLRHLQEVATRARMVPVSTIGPNLHRAVRDLARLTGKQVRWELEGGETEIDRNVLEKLQDPLLHLVRNAVDHGVETPEKRAAAGKTGEGLVKVQAAQIGSRIVITVSDDGGGVELEKVRAAAVREGLDVSRLSDAEVLELIFRPGMSTAERVTEVSGRGVGLDVVKTNLTSLRGTVQLTNRVGKGATFTLTVPITLTIVQCLTVRAGGQDLALPLHSIVALLPASTAEQHAGGRRMVVHGGAAIPCSSLAVSLGLGEPDQGPVVIVRAEAEEHAFRVESLIGQRDFVVKGLGRLLPRIDMVAGAAIEPNGEVIVVLDPQGLVEQVA